MLFLSVKIYVPFTLVFDYWRFETLKTMRLSLSFLQQMTKFGVIGVASNVAVYFGYLLLAINGLPPLAAMTVAFVGGVFISFYLNGKHTFKRQTSRLSFIKMGLTYLIAYLLNLFLLWLSVHVLLLPHQLAQGCLIFAIGLCLFLVQKYWVFKRP